jgi:AcrR family transcriptional regulator
VPPSERKPRKSTVRRRATVLDAALRCFTRQGFAQTTIADVRRASKTSTGSIYHHFSSKEELAAALYVDSLATYQRGFLTNLARARKAERGVRSMVAYHVDWVARNPDRARFLNAAERPSRSSPAGHALAQANRQFFDSAFAWIEEQMRAGAMRSVPRDLFVALVLGPAESYTRQWLQGRRRTDLSRARRALADGAWAAVKKRR